MEPEILIVISGGVVSYTVASTLINVRILDMDEQISNEDKFRSALSEYTVDEVCDITEEKIKELILNC